MNTGERLKFLREKYNFSQQDIAKKLQVTHSLISAYEHNEKIPSPTKLVQLADIYHVTVDYLLCRNQSSDKKLYLSLEGLSTVQIKLLRDFIDTIRTNVI
ncbi:MAG: helix-turn-helix domain-containing protein [Anaerocolumna sp.]